MEVVVASEADDHALSNSQGEEDLLGRLLPHLARIQLQSIIEEFQLSFHLSALVNE